MRRRFMVYGCSFKPWDTIRDCGSFRAHNIEPRGCWIRSNDYTNTGMSTRLGNPSIQHPEDKVKDVQETACSRRQEATGQA